MFFGYLLEWGLAAMAVIGLAALCVGFGFEVLEDRRQERPRKWAAWSTALGFYLGAASIALYGAASIGASYEFLDVVTGSVLTFLVIFGLSVPFIVPLQMWHYQYRLKAFYERGEENARLIGHDFGLKLMSNTKSSSYKEFYANSKNGLT